MIRPQTLKRHSRRKRKPQLAGKTTVWKSDVERSRQKLKLRPIGPHDYSVFEDGQRIGRIRFAEERIPGVWLWNVVVHLTGGLPMGSAQDLDTAKAEFKAAWEAL